ncbi:isocitrate lyase, partial [Halobacteriales archaeon QH_2_65_14]
SGAHSVYEDMRNVAQNDERAQFDLEDRYLDHETESHHELSFVSRFQDIETRFDPEARERIEQSAGFTEDSTGSVDSEGSEDPQTSEKLGDT